MSAATTFEAVAAVVVVVVVVVDVGEAVLRFTIASIITELRYC